MSLSLNRNTGQLPGASLPIDPIWVVAGLSMVGMAVSTFFLVPEESFAVALGLLVLLLAAADLRTGFLAFVLLYPFIPPTWGIDVAAWMPYLTAKRLCCLALSITFLVQSKNAWDTPRVKGITWFLIALVTVQILAGFGSKDPLSAVKRSFGDVVEIYLPFLMAAHLFRTKAQIKTLVTLATLSMGIAAILAVIEHNIDYNFYDSFVATRQGVQDQLTLLTEAHRGGDLHARRVRGAFVHPIEMGLHLMCIFLVLAYFMREKRAFGRVFLLASVPIFALALLYTYSRGPLLGLISGLLWLGLIGRGTRTLPPLILICGLGGYLLMPPQARDVLEQTIMSSGDLQSGNSIGGGTVNARLILLQSGLQFSQQNVWFGLGPGEANGHVVYGEWGGRVDFHSIDNFYLQVLMWHGVIVLAMTVGFYAYLLGMFTRAAQRLTDHEAALLAAIAASMCVANFVAMATVGFNITLFWILLGPVVRACDLYEPEVRRRGKPRLHRGREGNQTMGITNRGNHPSSSLPIPAGESGRLSRSWTAVSRPGINPRSRISRPLGAALAVSSLALAVASPLRAAPSFYGTTGLFSAPVAAVPARGSWSIGSNYVSRDYRPGASIISKGTVANYFTMTMLPRVELTVVLTNFEGKLGIKKLNRGTSPDYPIAGYNVDRTVSGQWLAVTQGASRPAIAFGARDIFGRSVKNLKAYYGVMSMGRGRLTLSAGLGTKALHGPFGGAEFALTPHLSAIAESLHGQTNGGFRLVPLKDFQLDAALMGFRSLGGGLSYRRRF